MDERDWDEIWADMDGTGRPDPLIGEFAEPSGRSLDLGCGLGENVMALAAAGWDAHGVDGSPVAVAKVTEIARALDLSARFTVADLADGASGSDFDLITMFYVHLQTDAHASLLGTIAGTLNPDGTFLYVGHDEDFVSSHHGRMGELTHEDDHDPYAARSRGHHESDEDIWADRETGGPDRIASLLTGLTIERAETVNRRIFHGPQELDVTDVVVVARKA